VNPRRAVALAVVLLALVSGAAGAGAATAAGPPGSMTPRRVLVVTLPRVTWSNLDATATPNLTRFLSRAAVASMSTRTVGPRTDPSGAYLTIGAGNRADSLDPLTAGQAADVGETTVSGPAADVYARRTGIRPTGEVVVLSIAEQVARNESLLYGSVPGSMGSALARAGHRTAVVGNADQSLEDGTHREVALGAMLRNGQVRAGQVGSSLLVADEAAPFGVRTDPAAVRSSVDASWATADVQLVEMSDLERAEQARAQSTPAQGNAQFRRALQRSDTLFGQLLGSVDPARDLVMVVGPTAPLSAEQLTVFGMRGPGISAGWARSPTTRRAGFMTLTDIAPTILERLGIDRPSSMNDTPSDSVATSAGLGERVDAMARDNDRALLRDEATGPITVAFIVLLVILLLLVGACVSARPSWATWLRWCCLLVLATPTATYLSGLLPYGPFVTVTFGLVILAIAAVLATLAWPSARWDEILPPVVVCAFAVVVLGLDIVTGGGLQLNTVFGYSPIVAGRFAGYGNQAFSILTISALIIVTAGWEVSRRRRPDSSDVGRIVATVVFFVVVVVLDGAPNFGADVGGVLASVPAFAICTLLLSGRRIRARLVALLAAVTVGVLGVFALIDLSRPVESRTHLGRFAAKLANGDALVILERKLDANISILTSTIWTVVIPVALVFIAYLTWRPNRMLRRINERHWSFRAFGISGLTLGVLAWAVNDSGVSIPALMLTVAIPYTAYLALQTLASEGRSVTDTVAPGTDPLDAGTDDAEVVDPVAVGAAGTEP
jgi:hypothetical protein